MMKEVQNPKGFPQITILIGNLQTNIKSLD